MPVRLASLFGIGATALPLLFWKLTENVPDAALKVLPVGAQVATIAAAVVLVFGGLVSILGTLIALYFGDDVH